MTTQTQPPHKTLADAEAVWPSLAPFIGRTQQLILRQNIRGEERQFFIDKICELADYIRRMPATYETDGRGDEAVVWLHYFAGGRASWWLTEKDCDTDGQGQHQAFGLADLYGDGGEIGYISIVELLQNGAELDFHFTPKPLAEVRKELRA